MKIKYIILIVLGVLLSLLGGLWLLQGLDLIRIEPVACVGDCQPVMGDSTQWTVIGGLVLATGVALVYMGVKFFRAHSRKKKNNS